MGGGRDAKLLADALFFFQLVGSFLPFLSLGLSFREISGFIGVLCGVLCVQCWAVGGGAG